MVSVSPLSIRPCIECKIRKNKHGLCLSGTFSLTEGSKLNNHANAYVISNPRSALGCSVIVTVTSDLAWRISGGSPKDTSLVLSSKKQIGMRWARAGGQAWVKSFTQRQNTFKCLFGFLGINLLRDSESSCLWRAEKGHLGKEEARNVRRGWRGTDGSLCCKLG